MLEGVGVDDLTGLSVQDSGHWPVLNLDLGADGADVEALLLDPGHAIDGHLGLVVGLIAGDGDDKYVLCSILVPRGEQLVSKSSLKGFACASPVSAVEDHNSLVCADVEVRKGVLLAILVNELVSEKFERHNL